MLKIHPPPEKRIYKNKNIHVSGEEVLDTLDRTGKGVWITHREEPDWCIAYWKTCADEMSWIQGAQRFQPFMEFWWNKDLKKCKTEILCNAFGYSLYSNILHYYPISQLTV